MNISPLCPEASIVLLEKWVVDLTWKASSLLPIVTANSDTVEDHELPVYHTAVALVAPMPNRMRMDLFPTSVPSFSVLSYLTPFL